MPTASKLRLIAWLPPTFVRMMFSKDLSQLPFLPWSVKASPSSHLRLLLTSSKSMRARPLKSLPSILAKVTRDDLMLKIAEEYPQYGFEIHKGYGTKAHYQSLADHGPSPVHRMTFLKKLYGTE